MTMKSERPNTHLAEKNSEKIPNKCSGVLSWPLFFPRKVIKSTD
jgi:hypothetical protein